MLSVLAVILKLLYYGVLLLLAGYTFYYIGIILVWFYLFAFVLVASILTLTTWPLTIALQHFGVKIPHAYRLFAWQFEGSAQANDPLPDGRYTWETEEEFKSRVYNEWREQKLSGSQNASTNGSPHAKEKTKRQAGEPFDPWKILDIPPGTPKKVIAHVYRQKMMKNHPDKVAALDPALQHFATERTKLLQRAYDTVMAS